MDRSGSPNLLFLILLVLTNDLHHKVFSFPEGQGNSSIYNYEMGYWFVLSWDSILALSAIIILVKKCRIPKIRKMRWLPLVPISIGILYCLMYVAAFEFLKLFAKDITVFLCLFFIATLESCIRVGLIRTNTCYKELFNIALIGAQITDSNFHPIYSAKNAKKVESSILAIATKEPFILGDGIRLSGAPIHNGYVFWQEDISQLLGILSELSGTKEELQNYGALLEEENKQKARRRKLEEQKRLYDTMSEKTFVQKQLISKLATELENAQNEDTARKLLGKIAVVGAYLKRRSNLIFLENQTEIVPLEELKLCLQESAVNLRLCGVTCAFQLEIDEELSLNIAAKLYDFYEAVVESSLDTLSGLTAVFGRENEKFRLGLMLYCDQYLWPLADNFPEATISKEDDTWYLTMEVQEGGAAV